MEIWHLIFDVCWMVPFRLLANLTHPKPTSHNLRPSQYRMSSFSGQNCSDDCYLLSWICTRGITYPPDPLFVPANLSPDNAEVWIMHFAEYQFRKKSHYLGLDPKRRMGRVSHVARVTEKMMLTWNNARRNPLCVGVTFALGAHKQIKSFEHTISEDNVKVVKMEP